MSNLSMIEKNSGRYLKLEDDFIRSHGAVSAMADLLCSVGQSEIELREKTMFNAGEVLYVEANNMSVLFYELMDVYLAERKSCKNMAKEIIDFPKFEKVEK